MGDRCLSLPTLRLIGEQRAWNGKPSTTQLLKCSREAYIEIMYDDLEMYPQDAMFRILGSKAHLSLEKYTPSELAEERLEDTESSGAFDLYDPESRTLYDYKTWGSYKVQQALGLKVKEVETGEVYKSGVNKGKAKTKKVIEKGEPDMFDVEMQLNDYRIKLEAAGFPVENMIVESIVRDGSTFIAASRGITQNAYLIPVRRLNDEEVKTYFRAKSELLLIAIEKKGG
jgi:hypothetical protein